MAQKFKSKFEKRIHDNEKRKESLKRKLNEKLNCREVIKSALATSSAGKSRKIVFDDGAVDTGENDGEQVNESVNLTSSNEAEDKLNLFDESDDDDHVNYEIEIKNKFEGKKGHKLLNLQSNYNNDDRFKLDERFYDEDDDDEGSNPDDGSHHENGSEKCENMVSNVLEEEKKSQLKILEDVLGQPIEVKQKKPKKSFVEMVRFDASNEDHKRREAQTENTDESKVAKKKLSREERKKKMEAAENESKANSTSEEKFYRVSDDLKVALKSGKSQNCQFSLLGAFSREDAAGEPSESEPESEKGGSVGVAEEEEEEEEKEEEKEKEGKGREPEEEKAQVGKAQGIKRESFFFVKDDPRIEEGLSFMNMKNSEEARRALENYDSTRRDIREVLRLRWQKHRHRNNPFKKKVGGSFHKNGQFNRKRNFFGNSKRTR